jgi:hypothetical protein
MRMRSFLLVPLLALAGCPLFSVEGEIPEMCMTFANREVEGVFGPTLTKTFTYDEPDVFKGFADIDATLTSARARLHAVSGVDSFAFLEGVEVKIQSGGLEPLTIVACAEGACASQTAETEMAADVPESTADYFMTGPIHVTVTLSGELPSSTWFTDVEVCVSGTASASLSL